MNTEQQLKNRIDEFIQDISGLVRQATLETISHAMGTGASEAPPAPSAAPTPRTLAAITARRFSGSRKRTARELEAVTQVVLDYISVNPGLTVEQLSDGLGVPTSEITLPIKKLLLTGKLARSGQKRATRYELARASGGRDRKMSSRRSRSTKTAASSRPH